MKKVSIQIYILMFFSMVLSSCGETIDNSKAVTKAYFKSEEPIKYEYKKEVEDDFLKKSYADFDSVKNATIDLDLDGTIITYKVAEFNPKVYTDKVANENQFYIEYDKERINSVAKDLSKKYSLQPVEPYFNLVNGKLKSFEGKSGFIFDIEEINKNLYNALKNREKYVKIESKIKKPKYEVNDLREISDLLGIFSTSLGDSSEGRKQNLTVASNCINNKIVMPNETFSMNEVLGDFTYDKGYVDAPVIVSGVLTNDIAGGVCQISSTLYNAVLHAELKVVERTNHSGLVKYLPGGFDATLATGVIDFKFKNNTKTPIAIISVVTEDKVIVSIYGREERPTNRTLKFWSEKTEVIKETGYDFTLDESQEPDYKKTVSEPKEGYIYKLYKTIYIDGEEVSTELVNESKYKSRKGKIVLGENAYKIYSK